MTDHRNHARQHSQDDTGRETYTKKLNCSKAEPISLSLRLSERLSRNIFNKRFHRLKIILSSDSHLRLHVPEKVKGLKRGHIVEVGGIQFIPERHQKRVLQLEER